MALFPLAHVRTVIVLLCALAAFVGCDGSSGDGDGHGGDTSVASIETVAGGFNIGDGGPATSTFLQPEDVAVAPNGDVLIVDNNEIVMNGILRRVDARTGTISTVGGHCAPTGGAKAQPPATICDLFVTTAAVDPRTGAILVATIADGRIYRVEPETGAVEPVAGRSETSCAYVPDAPPLEQCLPAPADLVFDANGSLYISELRHGIVFRLDPTLTTLSTVAGKSDRRVCSTPSANGVPATDVCLQPEGIAVDGQGNLFIADPTDARIDRVDTTTGTIATIAGGTQAACDGGRGDGGPAAEACFRDPRRLAIAPDGALLVADHDRVRRIDGSGTITTLADRDSVYALAPAPDGTLVFTEVAVVSRLDLTTGSVTPVAGNGTSEACGVRSPAHDACLGTVNDTTLAPDGSIYFADLADGRIGRVDTTGDVSVVADARTVTSCGDVGPRPDACLAYPSAITRAPDGTFYVSDIGDSDLTEDDAFPGRVRHLDPRTGVVTTIAGNCTNPDGNAALTGCLLQPQSLVLDGRRLWVGGGDGVHRIDLATGTMEHVVGSHHDGVVDCQADGIAAADACVEGRSLALDAAGDLYAIGFGDGPIRRVDAETGIVTTVAGNGLIGDCPGEDVPATSVCLNPTAIAIEGDRLLIATGGKLGIVDLGSGRIRSVTGFPDSCASVLQPDCVFALDIEIDRGGRLVIVEPATHAIRRVTLTPP